MQLLLIKLLNYVYNRKILIYVREHTFILTQYTFYEIFEQL